MYEGRFRVATRLPEARERLLDAVAEIDRHETVPVEAAGGCVLAAGDRRSSWN